MDAIYEYTCLLNGKARTVILSRINRWGAKIDFDKVLHDVALKLSMTPMGEKLCEDISEDISELTIQQILPHITPEMLVPYGIIMQILEDAEKKDCEATIVSLREMRQVRELCGRQLGKMSRAIKIFAERLNAAKIAGHPIISAWPFDLIISKATDWGYEFMMGDFCALNLNLFYNGKIENVQPYDVTGQ